MRKKQYEEDSLEQDIRVGHRVKVYDSRLYPSAKGNVIYTKEVDEDLILDVELDDNTIIQVSEIQCRLLKDRVPQTIWVKYEDGNYIVSPKRPEDEENWAMFKEELGE